MARADSPTALAVRSGYAEALTVLGLRTPQDVIDSVPAELAPEAFEEAVQALREAVHSGVATAALIHNDVDAIQVVQRLAELGVRVPEDLALIAYDDEVAALADTPSPPWPRPSARWAVMRRNCWWNDWGRAAPTHRAGT